MDKQFDARIQISIFNIFRQFGYSILHFSLQTTKAILICGSTCSLLRFVLSILSSLFARWFQIIELKIKQFLCHVMLRLVEKEWLRRGATLTFRYLFCGVSNDQHMNKYLLKLQFFPLLFLRYFRLHNETVHIWFLLKTSRSFVNAEHNERKAV